MYSRFGAEKQGGEINFGGTSLLREEQQAQIARGDPVPQPEVDVKAAIPLYAAFSDWQPVLDVLRAIGRVVKWIVDGKFSLVSMPQGTGQKVPKTRVWGMANYFTPHRGRAEPEAINQGTIPARPVPTPNDPASCDRGAP